MSLVRLAALCLALSACAWVAGCTGQERRASASGVEVEWRGQWYAASILAERPGSYLIHYDGWGDEWNEWVPPGRIRGLPTVVRAGPEPEPAERPEEEPGPAERPEEPAPRLDPGRTPAQRREAAAAYRRSAAQARALGDEGQARDYEARAAAEERAAAGG